MDSIFWREILFQSPCDPGEPCGFSYFVEERNQLRKKTNKNTVVSEAQLLHSCPPPLSPRANTHLEIQCWSGTFIQHEAPRPFLYGLNLPLLSWSFFYLHRKWKYGDKIKSDFLSKVVSRESVA